MKCEMYTTNHDYSLNILNGNLSGGINSRLISETNETKLIKT